MVSRPTNKLTELVAIALQYKLGQKSPPKIIAKGKGDLADQIISIAQEQGIKIEKNEELASILALLEIGETIPIETFAVVAEIISYIYKSSSNKLS